MGKFLTWDEAQERINKRFPDKSYSIIREGEFKGVNKKSKIKHNCEYCGNYVFEKKVEKFKTIKGEACPICNRNCDKSQEIIDYLLNMWFPDGEYLVNWDKCKYINNKESLIFIHKCSEEDIHEFNMNWGNFQAGYRCTVCRDREKNSLGERTIKAKLESLNIKFKHHYTGFKECKYENVLEFDFYLPDLNTIIEYDGEQHWKGWSGDRERAKLYQARDLVKYNYCKENNIRIIHIPYTYTKVLDDIIDSNYDLSLYPNILDSNNEIYTENYKYLLGE